MNKTTLLFVVISLLAVLSAAKRVKGSRRTRDQLIKVAQFTFSTNDNTNPSQTDNTIHVVSTSAAYEPGHAFWALYYDEDSSWRNVTKHRMNCFDMKNVASYVQGVSPNNDFIVPIEDYVRPHIWYVAILNCPREDRTKPEVVQVSYDIHFINTYGSEFGFDEQGMLPLNAVYFVFFLIVTCVEIMCLFFLHKNQSSHIIVYILTSIIAVMTFSLFFVMCHWASYKADGMGSGFVRGMGQFLMGISNIAFSMLLICIASGWSITYHELPRKRIVFGISIAYVVCYIILFIACVATGRSAASTQFVYATGATLAVVVIYILVCWLGIWGYFIWSLYSTWREESQYDKRLFFLIFGIGYSFYFLLPAVLNFISIGIDEWYRPRVVDAFQITTTFLGVVALVVLLWPTRMQKYFRMSQYGQGLTSTPSQP